MDHKEVRITVGTASHVVSRLYSSGALTFEAGIPKHEQYADEVKAFARSLIHLQDEMASEFGTA